MTTLYYIRNFYGNLIIPTKDLRKEYLAQSERPEKVYEDCDCRDCQKFIIDLWDKGQLFVERACRDGYRGSKLHKLTSPCVGR